MVVLAICAYSVRKTAIRAKSSAADTLDRGAAGVKLVFDALEAWLVNHGYKFEPGSGEAAAKAAVLTAGGPAPRRGGGGSFGGSHGSFSSGTQRITGSGTNRAQLGCLIRRQVLVRIIGPGGAPPPHHVYDLRRHRHTKLRVDRGDIVDFAAHDLVVQCLRIGLQCGLPGDRLAPRGDGR